jgi:hypothetical protein
MENELEEHGQPNSGSHWTCFQVNKYPSGHTEGVYFDSFGQPPPRSVIEYVGYDIPFCKRDIQILMNSACGWYCVAYLHYINSYHNRTKDIYLDSEHFLSLFHDLEKSIDFKYNEFVLKHFFRSQDPALRKPIDVK